MGLPYPGKQRDDKMGSFSHNILKFELSGPEYENFSVVDLPGLFRSKLLTSYHIKAKIRPQSLLRVRLAKKIWLLFVK